MSQESGLAGTGVPLAPVQAVTAPNHAGTRGFGQMCVLGSQVSVCCLAFEVAWPGGGGLGHRGSQGR